MIFELILSPIFLFLEGIIDLLPAVEAPESAGTFVSLLNVGRQFIGTKTLNYTLSSIIFWYTSQFSWSVIVWIYKKIPGVD